MCCLRRVALAAVFLLTTIGAALGAALVQDFYLPMPEAQIYQANTAIVSGTGSTIASTFSIVVTGHGTIIYYDQWEDGYETDLSQPTQPTTQIWGDGNDAHGIPPGFTHNPLGLPAGTIITLTNNVTLPRNPSQLLWDARDHIAATKALVVTRAAWPIPTGPVFAGAAGVLSTMDYGTNYISPVGQDMTNGLMKYVGMFVMAAQNNTSVLIDTNGTGIGTFTVVLNQGESYLINGGVKKGGRILATKPVQADLLIGHVGSSYASDWFTLYPVEEWDNTYYTPVGTSASGNAAYVYLFNPSTNPIVINFNTQSGSGSFSVPGTNGVFQFQMPVGSGASFVSAGGQNFFPICTVAASPANDTAYNWGFTLVPKAALTTEADVGWGPGSADGTVDGSPVWITPLAATRIYVDYKGDHLGPLTNSYGDKYDTNFDLTALQSKKIYDPSKNQTGMRVYTLDGTPLTAAWGEDPDVASPGNPYIDAGTTVLPFPVPVLKKSAVIVTDTPPAGLSLGDTIAYTVEIDNKGLLPLGNTVVIDAPTTNLLYLTNSTTWNGTPVPDSPSGTAFPLDAPGFTIPVILSRGTSSFTYMSKVVGSGAVSNSVNIGGTAIFSQAYLPPAITNGAAVSVNFTDTNGVSVGLYPVGANIFVTMTNAIGNTSSNSVQNITVTVQDLTHGDVENIVLAETGTNTGVFRNISGLPASATAGLAQQDGTLNVTPGDTLFVTYIDPTYGDGASNTALIQIPALTKQLYLSFTNGSQNLDRIDPVAFNHTLTRTSPDLSVAGVSVDSVTTVSNTTSLTATFPHTTGGANRLMLVGISINRGTGGTTFETPTNVTYAGLPLVQVGSRTNLTSQEAVVWIFVLTNPPAGTANVVVNWNMTQVDGDVIGCATFSGVNQATPYGPFFSNTGTSTAVSLTVNSAPGELVFDTVILRTSNFGAAGSPGASQSPVWKTYFNAKVGAGASTQPGAATVTDTWTSASSVDWSIGAISIKPAALSGLTNTTTFTQSPVFCSSFVMPSNNLVTVTNYITLTNGTLPLNPAVTATLQFGGANFLTLTNPTYSAASSNLVWSAVLSSNITVPGGQIISYVISNNQPGSAFHVNYDSTNAPSKITLPASTVIAINTYTFGVYDGPLPGGNLVTAPVAGSTLYVRATVSDPFGTYDVTGLNLAITAPVPAANISTNLSTANIVADDGCTRTYEYPWTSGVTTGGYNLVATATEGTEGITTTAAAAVTLIFLDLGTPGTTEFTSGNNGPATNAYPGSASGSACVRVTDLNRNTNSATVQNINAVVSSSSGDWESLTLTETGTNTGIFTACVSISTNSVNVTNDGTLFAPVGSVLTASYTDITDPSDTSSATATIQPLPGVPGVKLNKTVVSPAGGQVGVGQPVVFNLQVINIGSTVLTNVVVTDSFLPAKLNYSSASLAPTTVAAGALTWTNIGSMTPGQSTNITVNFTALTTGPATNSATANGVTATNSSSATVLVTHTALNITKMLLSPTNSPVSIGSNVVFRILVQNVGDTVIPTLPLEDNYSGAYFQFVSATIPPNGSGAGSLIWTNLASPVALATNGIITNDITMIVVGQGNPANNTAVADYAVDIFGNPVPVATGSTNIVTAAATINGFVYNDKDQSGTLTAGDTPLSGVTVQLYTDPTGTGTPGTLVQVATTSAGGYYELDNLTLGTYVVVAANPPGFTSKVPANGRLTLNLTTLAVSANNNFFQYQPSVSLYSTFTGIVVNDLAGTGVNTNQPGLGFVAVDLVQDVNSNGVADAGEPVVASATTDTNGNYSFAAVTPGHYVIRETDLYGYYSTGDAQPPNDNQISLLTTNGVTSTTNYFFDRLLPVAVNDTNPALYFIPVTINPLTNDISPNGDLLTISNAVTTGGILVINPGRTNLTFTPTNAGVATVIYTNADAHGGTSSAVITINVTALADLAVGKTASATVLAASNLTYSISVTNLGPSAASGVVVTDSLPNGVIFVSASSGGATNGAVVTWNLGTLANGAVSNMTLMVLAPASGFITNLATVGSPIGDPNLTNNITPPVVTTVTPLADVVIAKTGPASVQAAGNINYTINVTNLGPSSASSVVVTDALPVGVTFVNAGGGGATNSGLVSWSLGSLAAGQSSNFTVTVIAPTGGTLTNVANVASPTGDTNLLNNVTPSVVTAVTPVADLAVGKTGVASGSLGANFNYTISVTNLGPSSTAGFNVTDSLPVGIIFISSLPVTTTNAVNQIIWTNSGAFASGATTNLTLTVQAISRATYTNLATVGGPTLDNTPANNTSSPVATIITNRPPVAVNDAASTARNVAVTIPVLVNDSDPDGDILTIVSINPTNGTAIISGTNIVYTPTNAIPGTNIFSYSISDGFGGTNSAFVTVSVTNRPPVAVNDTANTPENMAVTVPVLVNDSDPDGDALTIVVVSPTNGTAVINGTNVIFTPATNFVGTAIVGYQIRDNFGGTNGALVTIEVTNTPPVANPDSFAITENTTNLFAVLGNDFVVTPGGSLTLVSVSTTNGMAVTNGPNIAFIPATNFLGTLTLNYTISDNVGGTNSSTVTVLVTNIPPVANPDSYTVLENSTNTLFPLVNDLVQTPGGSLSLVSLSATNGSATILDGTNVVFTPTTNFTGTATIGYTITDGIGGTNSSLITVTVLSVADLAVSKTGPANVYAATNFNYTITVTNFGPGTAANLSVTDNLPSTVTLVVTPPGVLVNGGQLVWTNLGSLAANAATNLTVSVTAPLATLSLTNIAGAGSPTSDPNPTNNTSPPVITTVTPVADLTIAKTGPAFVLAAGTINYTITVTNLGPSSASSVVVTDTLPAGVAFVSASGGGSNNSGSVNWSLGSLAAGQLSNLTVTVTASASGTLTNIANVASPTADTNILNNTTAPVVTAVNLLADLAIGKSAPATVLAASNLTYTITVTNLGPSTASSVVVTDSLPGGVSFVGASGGGVNNSAVVTWNFGDLVNGGISNVTLTVLAPASGFITNFATVGSPSGDPSLSNNITLPVVTAVIPLADLAIAKTGPANVNAATNFSYTISVTNFGPSSASSVVVTDTLPVGVAFVSASVGGTNNSGLVNWSLGTLATGQASNLTVTVTAPANGVALTNVANVISSTGDTNILNNLTPPVITTVIPVADVSVVKAGPAGIIFGTNFNYTIMVSNAGPSTAASVMVTDSLPTGLVFISAVPATTTNTSGQVIWNLGNFAAGVGSNLTLAVISTQRGSLTNLASGGSPTPDPVPTNNLAPPVVTAVTNNPPIAIPDRYAIAENTTNTFSPLVNDVVQTPGGSLTIIALNATNGTATIVNNTNVIFTPTNNFLGTIVIGYTITDNVGGTNSSFITVLVTNIPPVANPDSFAVPENTTNSLAVLLNDFAVTPGGTVTLLSVSTTNGVATTNGANVIFTPAANFLGTLTLNYSITDDIGGTNSSHVTVLVTNVPPVANPDAYSMAENTTNAFTPLVNDLVKTPGGVLQIISVTPTNGSATVLNLTNVVFTPTTNFVGTTTIGYTITDGIGGTNSSVITVAVTNIPPTAFGQSLTTTENTALPITLAGSDPAGHPLTFIIVGGPTGGTVTGLNPNTGALIYTPTNNFTGPDTFTFHVNNGFNNSSNATVSIAVVPVADLLVAQSGPAGGVAGADLTFTVAVTNLGPASATNLVVTNQLDAGFTFVSASAAGASNGNHQVIWTVPVLPANGATNFTVTLFAVEGGTFTNVASGISTTPDLNVTNNDGSLTNAKVITTISALADVAVFKSGTTSVLAGGTVNYTITATNIGPSTASNVVVRDTLPPGAMLPTASGNYSVSNGVIIWTAAILSGGTATNFTVTLTAPNGGTLTNVASSTSDTADPNPGNNDGSSPGSVVITPVTPVADLAIGKSATASVLATSNLIYTISVTNFGPSTASSVTVTDALPAGANFVSSSGGGTNNAGVVAWGLGNLASGAVSNVTLTVTAPASGMLTNSATVSSPTSDPNLTNNMTPPVITTVIPQADLQIGKTAALSVLATSNLAYTISVTNFGPSTASSVIVTDALPAGAIFVGTSAGGANSSGVVTWSLGDLPSGTVSNVTLTVTAPTSGTLTNIATVGSPTGDPKLTNNITPPVVTTVIPQADLQIGKSAAASVLATSNLVYIISVTNFGPSTASSVTVTDTVPTGTTFISANNGGLNNSGVVIWTLGDLSGGIISNVTLTVAAPTSGTLTNIASVGSPTGDPNPTNNLTPPVVTTITPVADVAIGKSGPAGAIFNTSFSYTISVTNFGPSAASGILVTDSLPAGLVFVSAVPATATNAISEVIWNLGNLSAGMTTNLTVTVISAALGAVTNLASVGAPTLDLLPTNNISQPVVTLVTNIPPVANPDSYAIAENSGTNTFSPLLNDVVLNPGGTLQLISVSTTNGSAVISGNNVLFVSDTNYVGLLTINYTITDNVGGTNSSFIMVLVTNIPPLANPDSYTVAENSGTATLSPLVNDIVQTPGGILNLVSVSATNGVAIISGTNVLFAPAVNFFGAATIGYTVTDGIGGTNTSLIAVNVTNVPPVANGQSVNTAENVAVQITLTGNDPNHLPLTFAIVGNPPNGTVSSLNPNAGTVTYTPGTNYAGADSFTFRVNNGQTNSAPATVTISIAPVADLAVVQSGPASGFAGSNLVFTVTITNRGPATATSVVVSNLLAPAFTFVSASGGGVQTGNLVVWNFASLPANGVTNFTVTAFALEGGSYTNIASGASALLDLNPTNNNGSLAAAQSVTILTPVVDLVVFKDGGTNVFAGALVNYTITASNAGPSTATSVVVQDTLPAGAVFQSASGGYSVSNGVVTWSGLTLVPGKVATFNLTLLATASASSFVNIASGTSAGYDPNPTNNNGSYAKSRVTTKVTPSADVIAAIAGPASAVLGNNIVFTLTITNAGPSTASNVVASDVLPPNLLFVSASNGGTNSHGTNASGTITWPPIISLGAGGTTNFTFTTRSLVVGLFTNVVSSTSSTFDPDPTNNTGVLPTAQAQTQVSLPQFTLLSGAPVFNPQTGLYEEQVTVTNSGTVTVAGVQLYVSGLRSGVSLYNATGTNGGVPYVQYGFPLDPSNSVHFVLEFYNPSRQPFNNTLYALAYMPSNAVVTNPSNSVPVNKVFTDTRTSPPRFVIEWASIPGKTYIVIYASSLNATSWFVATPSITASANVTQWYDDGPPKTSSAPLSVNTRFYRVIQY